MSAFASTICHRWEQFDIVSDHSVYYCECGRRFRCVISPWNSDKYVESYWAETWSWARLFRGRRHNLPDSA